MNIRVVWVGSRITTFDTTLISFNDGYVIEKEDLEFTEERGLVLTRSGYLFNIDLNDDEFNLPVIVQANNLLLEPKEIRDIDYIEVDEDLFYGEYPE